MGRESSAPRSPGNFPTGGAPGGAGPPYRAPLSTWPGGRGVGCGSARRFVLAAAAPAGGETGVSVPASRGGLRKERRRRPFHGRKPFPVGNRRSCKVPICPVCLPNPDDMGGGDGGVWLRCLGGLGEPEAGDRHAVMERPRGDQGWLVGSTPVTSSGPPRDLAPAVKQLVGSQAEHATRGATGGKNIRMSV